MAFYDFWDEPSSTGNGATPSLPDPVSQPGRWAPRPSGSGQQRPEIKITHPDSWFFLKALLPQPFRSMDLRPERILPAVTGNLPKTPALEDAHGRVIFLQPSEGRMPEEALAWVKEAALQKRGQPLPSGSLVVSRAATDRPFFLVQLADDAVLGVLEKSAGLPVQPSAPSVARLLSIREAVWRQKSEEYLKARARSPRLCGPGELLGWLSYPDRQLLLRKLNARLGLASLRSLFYESRREPGRPQLPKPDPWTSFPLLMDSLPPGPSAAWKWLRFDPDAHSTPLAERHRRLWVGWLGQAYLLDGFSPAFLRVWEALVAGPLARRYRDAILQLDAAADITPELRRLEPPKAEWFLRSFRHRDLARVFWGRLEAWHRVRHLVSSRYEAIVKEEMGFLDREASRREPDWAAVFKAKLRWAQTAKDLGIALEVKSL